MHFRHIFRRATRADRQNSRAVTPALTILATASGLMSRQHGGAVCINPEQKRAPCGHLHDFKTTARIAAPQ
jgi:hypothetical protein